MFDLQVTGIKERTVLKKLHALLKKGSDRDVGLVISDRALALVQRERMRMTGRYGVVFAEQCDCTTPAQQKSILQNWVNSHSLRKAPVNLILPQRAFDLVQLERPDVLDTELNAAIRWRLKDSVDYPVSEAIVDTFPVPAGRQSGNARVYVSCAPQTRLKTYVNLIEESGMSVRSISIAPLAMRNLAQYSLNTQEAVGFVHITTDDAALYICRGELFYLSRVLNISQVQLATDDLSEREALSEQLALEIQRTLDYYDSYFGHSPIRQLWFESSPQAANWLAEQIGTILGLRCAWLKQLGDDLHGVVNWGDLLPLALGGLMDTE